MAANQASEVVIAGQVEAQGYSESCGNANDGSSLVTMKNPAMVNHLLAFTMSR